MIFDQKNKEANTYTYLLPPPKKKTKKKKRSESTLFVLCFVELSDHSRHPFIRKKPKGSSD